MKMHSIIWKSLWIILKYLAAIVLFAVILTALLCDTTYKVVYVPLNSQFYKPLHPKSFHEVEPIKIQSILLCMLMHFVNYSYQAKPSKSDFYSLRIMILDDMSNKEIYVTQNRVVLSVVDSVKYGVPELLVTLIDYELMMKIDHSKYKLKKTTVH